MYNVTIIFAVHETEIWNKVDFLPTQRLDFISSGTLYKQKHSIETTMKHAIVLKLTKNKIVTSP